MLFAWKDRKIITQDSWSAGQDLNLWFPKYGVGHDV
jgi:hypothetical protein